MLSFLVFGAGGGGGGGSGGCQGGGGGGGGGGSLGIAVPLQLDFAKWDHYVILGAPGRGGVNAVNEGARGEDGKPTILFRTPFGVGPHQGREVLVAFPGGRGGTGGGEGPGGGPRGPLGGAGGAGGGIGGTGGTGGGGIFEKPANAGADGGSSLGVVFGPFRWPVANPPAPYTDEGAFRNFGSGGAPAVFPEGPAGGGGGGGAGHGKGGDGGTLTGRAQPGARGAGGGGGSAWSGDASPGKGGDGGAGFLEAHLLP